MNLKEMSIAQITVVYNDAAMKQGAKTRKGFPDKDTALKLTKALLANNGKAKVKAKGKSVGQRVKFPLPAAPSLSKIQRPGSLGAELAVLLKKGATKKEMGALFATMDKKREGRVSAKDHEARAWTTMLILHRSIGYGVMQTGDMYKLVTPKGSAPQPKAKSKKKNGAKK